MSKKTENRLVWKPINLKKKLQAIQEAIQETTSHTPSENIRLLNKLKRWKEEIADIQESMERVDQSLVPHLQKTMALRLKSKELIQVAMFQPSTKNIFLEIETHYKRQKDVHLTGDTFSDLVNLSEMAKVLALLGDAAISMGVVHHLWSSNIADVGALTQQRADVVSNEHMADVCDRWKLYDYRIHFDPDTPSQAEMNHDKGTLLEAVFGIIHIERGFRGVREKIKYLF